MSFSHAFTWILESAGIAVQAQKSYSEAARADLDESIVTASTDLEIGYDLDVSAVKSFFMLSDANIKVDVNNAAGVGGTIDLIANVPYIWTNDSYDAFLFAADMTALFITNVSGATARLQIFAIVDPTP